MINNLAIAWSQQTKKIYNGVLLYSIAGIIYAIFEPINDLQDTANTFSSLADGGGKSTFGDSDVVKYSLLACIIIGYFLFLKGLKVFATLLEPADQTALGKVRTGVILSLIATGVDFIPFFGWAAGILNIIAFILMIIGYAALKNSPTFPDKARKGASRLFISMILLIIGGLLGFIPIAGGFIEMIFDIIAFIMVLSGWKTIKNSTPMERAMV